MGIVCACAFYTLLLLEMTKMIRKKSYKPVCHKVSSLKSFFSISCAAIFIYEYSIE
ncbi:hypothetical protein NTE_01892 [Candidatus Nitrososphaera evergladensis SR1]|uniref:Uncharacterized protein n=1 Tax=Candidatus Nitrososphaera evergladensis SR1 TaxID=1459636 RepID=A0A075MQX1_9ARCH|nr:hypothetical protein NTE_01892 [Candidatus Nitrososphaera evergladensis SR1]